MQLRINISSSNGDNRSQDDLSEMSTISSSEEVQDNLESMERSPRIQAECLRLCRALGVKQRGYDCVVLIFGCLLVFDFFLQLQRKLTEIGCGLESKDPPEHFIQWATVFTPLWIVTLFFLCRRLFELISIEFGTGNNDTLMVSGGLTAYFCVAWGCVFCLAVRDGGNVMNPFACYYPSVRTLIGFALWVNNAELVVYASSRNLLLLLCDG